MARNYYIKFYNNDEEVKKLQFAWFDFLEFSEEKYYSAFLEVVSEKAKELNFEYFKTYIATGNCKKYMYLYLDFLSFPRRF